MSIATITILMFAFFIVALFMGVPLAFVLGAVGVIFTVFLWGTHGLYIVASLTWKMMSSEVLIAVPLFILMGAFLQRSGIADSLYETAHKWAGPLHGGLAIGTIVICALFGAMAGIAGAATVSLGLIAIPSMKSRGYSTSMSVGPIAAGGTLGILIPPSVPMIFYGLFARMSIGKLFLAGILPGVLIAILLIIYIIILGIKYPESCPALPPEERVSFRNKIKALLTVLPVILLIAAVLGSIFSGMATPTESAIVGVIGSFLIALYKKKVTWIFLKESTFSTLSVTTMVLWVMIGAAVFAGVYQALGASELLQRVASGGIPGGKWIILLTILVLLLVLGMFLDAGAVIILLVPTVVPLIETLGFNTLWFSILFVLTIMIGYLSPPFGLCLFYLRGVAPPDIKTIEIYKAVLPYIAVLLIGLIILIIIPEISIWLPRFVMGY